MNDEYEVTEEDRKIHTINSIKYREKIHIGFIKKAQSVNLERSVLPRMCDFSGKNIFYKLAYKVSVYHPSHYAHSAYTEVKWYEPSEFIRLKLLA